MSDIVERLRNDWDCVHGDEAADEIERLRANVKAANAVTEEHYAEIERLRGLLTAWVLAFEMADYPETMVEIVSYGSDTGIGTKKSLVLKTNEALGRVPKPF